MQENTQEIASENIREDIKEDKNENTQENGKRKLKIDFKVKKKTLLLIACLVWTAAGVNILRLGLLAYPAYLSVWNFLLSALVFGVFQVFIFGKLVKKHTARITGYEEERQLFIKFFDVKAFIIMFIMMTGGIWLRGSGVAPERFIAFFYTGLGASLTLAGVLFGRNYIKALKEKTAADSAKQ